MANESKTYNVEEFNHSKFPLHGKVFARTEANLLIFDLVGPFNQEFISALYQFRMKILQDWSQSGFYGMLINISESIMLSPAAFLSFAEGVRNSVAQFRPVAQAWSIAKDVEGRIFMIPKIETLYRDLGIAIKFFDEENSARCWLIDLLKSNDVLNEKSMQMG